MDRNIGHNISKWNEYSPKTSPNVWEHNWKYSSNVWQVATGNKFNIRQNKFNMYTSFQALQEVAKKKIPL